MDDVLMPDDIKNAGFDVTEIAEQVFLVHDFVSVEDREKIISIGNNASQDDWEKEYRSNLVDFCMRKFGRSDIDNLVKEGKLEITDNWDDKNLRLSIKIVKNINDNLNKIFSRLYTKYRPTNAVSLQRQYSGVRLVAHVDNHTDPSLVYAAVMYLNDDYADGEFFFTHLNIRLKPKAGSLLIFPTGEKYLHGVEAVGDGPVRYVLPTFIGEVGFYDKNKY